jgi:hypothetical protein
MTDAALSAEYADKLACPGCGAPARLIGRWYTEKGEYRFQALPVSAKKPRKQRPEYDGHRWTNYPHAVVSVNPRTGAEIERTEEEWHYVVEYECTGFMLPATKTPCSCSVLHRLDCKPYRGPVHEWMLPETDPKYRRVDTRPLVEHATT